VHFAYVITLERALTGGVPTRWLQHWHAPGLVWGAITVYLSYFIVPSLAPELLWWGVPRRFPRYVAAALLVFAGAIVCHVLLPTAPPWLAARYGYVTGVRPFFQSELSYRLPAVAPYGLAVIASNPVAAMPSVHVGMVVLLALAATGRPRWLAAAYACAMTLAVVYLGEHYVVDALGGALLAGSAWGGAGMLLPRDVSRQPNPRGSAPRKSCEARSRECGALSRAPNWCGWSGSPSGPA
jgi:hypothetical protein